MKKILFLTILTATLFAFFSCNEDDNTKSESIFKDGDDVELNEFDYWLLDNYTYPYNIEFKYRYDDKEAHQEYDVVPADYDKSVALAKLIKFLWIDAYNEIAGKDFLRKYSPRMLQLLGSSEYKEDNTEVLGTAEGGMKIFLTKVNSLEPDNLDMDFVKFYFIKTMFHEFAHIMHQTKNYTTDFNTISTDYQGPSWVNVGDYLRGGDTQCLDMGFVSAYGSSETQEDFVEILSTYVVYGADYWDEMMSKASDAGAAKIEAKFDIVKDYMATSWGVDLVKLQEIVQRRMKEVSNLDLATIK